MTFMDSFRALGRRDLPDHICMSGKRFECVKTYKHSSVSAVGKYEARDGDVVVLKCYREAPFLLVPMAWCGALMAAYEAAVLKRVDDVRGVPRLRGRYGRTGLVRDYVRGQPLRHDMEVQDGFFDALYRILGEVHNRGIAYVDLEKPSNIILGEDGLPYLIDFQVAFHVPARYLGQTCPMRWIRRRLQQADMYHARKHYRRLMKGRLSAEEIARLRRKPRLVEVGNVIGAPLKKLRRRLLGKQ